MSEKTTLEIDEAAFVLNGAGDAKLLIPEMGADSLVPENCMVIMAIATLFVQDEKFRKIIDEKCESMVCEAEEIVEDET